MEDPAESDSSCIIDPRNPKKNNDSNLRPSISNRKTHYKDCKIKDFSSDSDNEIEDKKAAQKPLKKEINIDFDSTNNNTCNTVQNKKKTVKKTNPTHSINK